MDPTTTEHDWRFPRRPDSHRTPDHMFGDGSHGRDQNHDDGNGAPPAPITNGVDAVSNNNVLGSALFPSLDNAVPIDSAGQLQQLQHEDPLAAQVWKFFSKTKQQLPNQQRMENLTWRMMALNMRRRKEQQEHEQIRYLLIFLKLSKI